MRKRQKGFSLIELLIVVAIILIIAAIAIPNLIRSKMSANEASAVASLRTINTAEVTYNTTYPGTFATQDQLGPGAAVCGVPSATNACLIDYNLELAQSTTVGKNGYYFLITPTATNYTSEAEPMTPGSTGTRGFCSDQDLGMFYVTTGAGAGTCVTGTALPL